MPVFGSSKNKIASVFRLVSIAEKSVYWGEHTQKNLGGNRKNQPLIEGRYVKSINPTFPADAEFKGYERVVVEEILIKTDNVEHKKGHPS